MPVIKIPYRHNNQIFFLANWLTVNAGGPSRILNNGGRAGPGWKVYHTTEKLYPPGGSDYLPYVITKAEIDDPEIASMFALRWL